MKEQMNIEGTVDKTSLKCKGVWILFSRFSFVTLPLWHLHPENTPSFCFHLSFLPSPPGSRLPYATRAIHPSIHPSNLEHTHFHLNENNSLVLTFPEFLVPGSSNWDISDQVGFFCTVLAINKTSVSHPHLIHSTDTPVGITEELKMWLFGTNLQTSPVLSPNKMESLKEHLEWVVYSYSVCQQGNDHHSFIFLTNAVLDDTTVTLVLDVGAVSAPSTS